MIGSLMLDLLNEYATYVNITWGREAAVKVHCSTGQVRLPSPPAPMALSSPSLSHLIDLPRSG
jgi:hypothetical protein